MGLVAAPAAAMASGLALRLAYLLHQRGQLGYRAPTPGLDADLYHGLALRVAAGDLALGDRVYHYGRAREAYLLLEDPWDKGSDDVASHLLYVDNGADLMAETSISALHLLCSAISRAYERVILERKRAAG